MDSPGKENILIADSNGRFYLIDDELNRRSSDLRAYIDEAPVEDFSLELICADFYSFDSVGKEPNENLFAYASVCWVYYDNLFRPNRQMLTFFRINIDFTFELRMCECYNTNYKDSFSGQDGYRLRADIHPIKSERNQSLLPCFWSSEQSTLL